MINKDGGTIFGFYGGDTAVMRGDIEPMGEYWKKTFSEVALEA